MLNSNKRRTMRIGALALAGSIALACAPEETPSGGDLCTTLAGYAPQCSELTSCEAAIVRDCSPLQSVLAPAFAERVVACMNGLGDPMGCLDQAVDETPSSTEVEGFATTFCLECGAGAGECEDAVLAASGNSNEARAGRLARALAPSVLVEVASDCATGEGCGDSFVDCATMVVARTTPNETSTCVVDAVVDGAPSSCAMTGGDDVADMGEDSGTGGMDAGSDEGPADTGSDDATDDSGDCTEAGCACEFTEDCDDGLTCTGDLCVAPLECDEDANEPNNGEDTSTFLPPIGDDDGEQAMMTGLLAGESDVDWFRYEGSDNFGSVVNPYAQLNVLALELCIYADCNNGLENTSITCPDGVTQSPSPGGRPGCCAANTMGFELSLSCTANPLGSDDANIYMSVRDSEPGVCQEFTLTYHY